MTDRFIYCAADWVALLIHRSARQRVPEGEGAAARLPGAAPLVAAIAAGQAGYPAVVLARLARS